VTVADLAARAEVAKLARELALDADRLAFLQAADRHELAALRETISGALFAAQEPRLRRIAALGKLLPTPITARIAEAAFGPMLSGRIAGVLDVSTAVRLAAQLKPAFLAEVSKWIDPARTASIVRALPDPNVITVGRHLLEQGDYVTLGRFVSVVSTEVALGVVAHANDRQLLHVALCAEDQARMSQLVHELPDERIVGVVAAAAEAGAFDEALTLLVLLEPAERIRAGGLAASLDLDVRNGIVESAVRLSVWPEVLSLLAELSDDARRRLVNVPATLDPNVIAAAVRAAREHDLGAAMLPMLGSLDEQHLGALGAVPELADLIPGLAAETLRTTGLLSQERRDELVIRAVQHQGPLPDQPYVGEARPSEDGELLVSLPTVVGDQALEHVEEVRVVAQLPAVELDGHLPAPHRIEPPGGDDLPEDRPRRLDEWGGSGAHEDEPPAAAPVSEGEVLGQRTAPRHAEDVGDGNVEVGQQGVDHPADLGKQVRPARPGRLPDTRRVEAHEPCGGVEGLQKRHEHLNAAP